MWKLVLVLAVLAALATDASAACGRRGGARAGGRLFHRLGSAAGSGGCASCR
jgi:hypothetical protein